MQKFNIPTWRLDRDVLLRILLLSRAKLQAFHKVDWIKHTLYTFL